MKIALNLIVSVLAVSGLLASASTSATNVAELPLKASVLAKPNVIVGLDDSGSMDSEVMLGNNDGAFWWDYSAASGWDTSGVTWFNGPGTASTQWRKMVYLFPNGTGTGERIYADATNDHFAIPPTAQMAFLRSPDYNPLYFNPTVTYKPWAPGYVSGATVNYANATTTAAKSSPVVGTSTFDLSLTRAASTTANNTFMVLPGMSIPAGSQTCDHTNCSSWTNETVARTLPANQIRRLSMAYFPATYYLKETCTVDGTTCVSAPDGATLKRYEIKSANYATAALYNAELQNFANWFTYYRKRKLMLSSSMGKVMEQLTGLRMGVVRFNNLTSVTMYDIDSTTASSNRLKVAGLFYETNGSGGTPTRETLKHIGEQYRTSATIIQYACQRNNAFIMTDGFANASSVAPPSYSSATWGSGVPYQTTYANTLADIGLSYYTNNLKASLATGRVPTTPTDSNTNLHMNTYGLTLGAKGTIYLGAGTPPPTTTGAWPNPTADRNPTAVDDLWHATINGRGQMYRATTSDETAATIQAGLTDILAQTGAQGGIAVSTVNLQRGDSRAYFGTYNPAGWSGDLTANPIDVNTGVVSTTATWSASSQLTSRDWTTRVIASHNGTSGVGFTVAAVGGTDNPSSTYGDTTLLTNYLRGDRTGEGTSWRRRTSLMGAIINSEPVVSREDGVVYVASGEGMLHAFDTTTPDLGKELWAFVPRAVLPDIGQTSQRSYTFKTQLDGSPVIGKTGTTSKLLVAGMGAAGRSYYAIDVTSPRGLNETTLAAKVKWEFPSISDGSTQAKVGQTVGRPLVVRLPSGSYAVIVTSGYNSTSDGKGRLWMLNPDTGAIIHEFTVADGSLATESGLAQVSPFVENTGAVQYVYGGDLLGNLWRFDLVGQGTPTKIAVLKDGSGNTQPVTAAPELLWHANKRIVIVGTGRLLDITDFGSSRVQTMYAIADGTTLSNARSSLVSQTYTRSGDTITNNSVDWATQRGWYLDLPAGEQANTRPTIAYGAIAFTTNVNGGSDCSASSYLYVLDVLDGGRFAGASFVGSQISATANSSGVNALLTGGGGGSGGGGGGGPPPPPPPPPGSDCQHIVGAGQTADGTPWNRDITTCVTINPSKNAWREIRR